MSAWLRVQETWLRTGRPGSHVALSNLQAWGARHKVSSQAFKQKTKPSEKPNKCIKQPQRPQLTGHFVNTLLWCFYKQDNFINIYVPKHDYYDGIMLDAGTIVLCSKLSQHNLSNPTDPFPRLPLKHIQNQDNGPHGFKPVGVAHECLISRCFIVKSGV